MGNLSFLQDLEWRGLVHNKTPNIEAVFKNQATLYFGIDPTGDSLHIGHLLGYLVLKRALEHGHKIIVIAGGGTAKIGDPSGKDKERPILTEDEITRNKTKLRSQIENLFEFDGRKARMLDNAEWLDKEKLIPFMREVGKYIPINNMLDKEAVASRMERKEGISYAEFSYQLLQAYDYYKLYTKYDCNVQIGGSDQWGNIIQGLELIRKKTGDTVHALGFPLITDPATGKKFGKTSEGTGIWLDPKKTHPFKFYNYLINTTDQLASQLLKFYSFRPRPEIEKIIQRGKKDPAKRLTQTTLANEITKLVHGAETARQASKTANILYGQPDKQLKPKEFAFLEEALPTYKLSNKARQKKLDLRDILTKTNLAQSKSKADQLIKQGGIYVNGESVSNNQLPLSKAVGNKYFLIRRGKKKYAIVKR